MIIASGSENNVSLHSPEGNLVQNITVFELGMGPRLSRVRPGWVECPEGQPPPNARRPSLVEAERGMGLGQRECGSENAAFKSKSLFYCYTSKHRTRNKHRQEHAATDTTAIEQEQQQ